MATATPPKPVVSPPSRGTFDATLASARSTIAARETIALAIDSFKASKARFLLTMLGMVIGSASIVLVVTVGLTGKQYALDQISGIGPNMVEMQYVGGTVAGPDNVSSPDSMTIMDMDTVNSQVPGIVASSPMLEFHDRLSVGSGVAKDTMLPGRLAAVQTGAQPEDSRRAVLRRPGRRIPHEGRGHRASVCDRVVRLGGRGGGTHHQRVGNSRFTVIGVFKEGTETFGQSEISNQTILIPYPVARVLPGNRQPEADLLPGGELGRRGADRGTGCSTSFGPVTALRACITRRR